MGGFSGISGIGWIEDWKIIKGKLIDGKKLSVCLWVNYSR